jgi:hypothetical protein
MQKSGLTYCPPNRGKSTYDAWRNAKLYEYGQGCNVDCSNRVRENYAAPEKQETYMKKFKEKTMELILKNGLVRQPGWLSNKSCKMRSILPFSSVICSETDVSEQL